MPIISKYMSMTTTTNTTITLLKMIPFKLEQLYNEHIYEITHNMDFSYKCNKVIAIINTIIAGHHIFLSEGHRHQGLYQMTASCQYQIYQMTLGPPKDQFHLIHMVD